MTDSSKNFTKHQVVLDDSSLYYYTINEFELSNILGPKIIFLQEYNIIKMGGVDLEYCCKLYKTTEGSWYEIDGQTNGDKLTIRKLKSEIDANESEHLSISRNN
jgi:hypothetical protein